MLNFLPDFLDIPTMLFFFHQKLTSFLRAKSSQMSCRKKMQKEEKITDSQMEYFPDGTSHIFAQVQI